MNIINRSLDLIFPPICGICGKIDNNYLCEKCALEVEKIKKDREEVYDNKLFNKHFYIFEYKGIIRKKIIDYKFNNKGYLYRMFEKIMINDKKMCEFIKCYDIIIPVPIHKKRKKIRGYNQSALLIEECVKEIKLDYNINIEYNENILYKNRNTQKQSSLNKIQREKNVKNVYEINEKAINKIKDKNILIFDDIYTTGNTVNECARVLELTKAKSIDVFTLTKD